MKWPTLRKKMKEIADKHSLEFHTTKDQSTGEAQVIFGSGHGVAQDMWTAGRRALNDFVCNHHKDEEELKVRLSRLEMRYENFKEGCHQAVLLRNADGHRLEWGDNE